LASYRPVCADVVLLMAAVSEKRPPQANSGLTIVSFLPCLNYFDCHYATIGYLG
jgi:hypothetical protein